MADEQKSPMWLALLAGALVMGTGPLALAFIVVLGRDGFDGLAELVMEGGAYSYAVLLGGALASMIAAILLAISVRRPTFPATAALLPFLLPMLAALAGVAISVRGMLDAIAYASPADRATIFAGAISELMSLSVQSLAFAAAGTLLVALGALVSLAAPPRGARSLAALGSGALGLSLAAMALQGIGLRSGFRAIASVDPTDRLNIFRAIIEEWQASGRITNGLFFLSLAIALVGGALLVARSEQRATAIGTAAMLLIAAVGLRGSNALTEKQLAASPSFPAAAALRVVDGARPRSLHSFELPDESPAAVDQAVLGELALLGEGEPKLLGLSLAPGLQPHTVMRGLQTAHAAQVELELVGDGPKQTIEAPPIFKNLIEAMNDVRLAVPVSVLFPDEECDGCIGLAKVMPKGLQVGEALWEREANLRVDDPSKLPRVEFAYGGDVEALIRAAVIATSHGHLLMVRVPDPVPYPRLPK